jgi:hypothetical protein
MARKPSTRVVMNRAALRTVDLAVADGLEEVVRTVVETATPPDATPYGTGLVTRGGWLVYAGADKVGGGSLDGRQPKKPRSLRVRGSGQIQAIAGFGFPGRFQEAGTAKMAAQPFLTPAAAATIPHAPAIMKPAVKRKLG